MKTYDDPPASVAPAAASAWDVRSLTPLRCRLLLAILLAVGFLLHLVYLLWDCPIDLTGDEAHYWDWSRSPDVAYYSKGPLVAWVIRASCAIFGDVMWAVRLPALLLAVVSSILSYLLMRKLFGSERLALGAVALNHTVPLFVAGSFIMTIDPPFFVCWGGTTYFAALALFDERRWPWVALGLTAGVGLLAKYAMPLWYVGLLAFLLIDRPSRRWLATPWPWLALAITLLFFAAPLWWNDRNDWVTFRHVGRQTGVTQGEGAWYVNPPLMIGTQAGVVGPVLAVFIACAVAEVFRRTRRRANVSVESDQPLRRAMFLLCIGGSFFAVCLVASLRVEIEANWPAPAFFTLTLLAAWWLGRRLESRETWEPVRGFFWAHVSIGVVAAVVIHQTHLLYPLASRLGIDPRRVDLAQIRKARGNAEIGAAVSDVVRAHPEAFVLGRSYQDSSLLGFYVAGQPRVFDIGTYLVGRERTRHSQFDLWADRDLSNPALIGRDAIFVGTLDRDGIIERAFDRIERVREVTIIRGGVEIRSKPIYIGYHFKGVRRAERGSY